MQHKHNSIHTPLHSSIHLRRRVCKVKQVIAARCKHRELVYMYIILKLKSLYLYTKKKPSQNEKNPNFLHVCIFLMMKIYGKFS